MSSNYPARTKRNIQTAVLQEIFNDGLENGMARLSTYVQKFSTVHQKGVDKSEEALSEANIWLAGRTVGMYENDDKEATLILQDETGRVEILLINFVPGDTAGHGSPEVGDIVEIKVRAGEKILNEGKSGIKKIVVFLAEEILVLAKNSAEFFIKKEDPNWKKMIIDLNLKDKLEERSKIIQKIREFFLNDGFIESDTPTLVKLPGMEPYLDVFKTQFVSLDKKRKDDLYLITSPEYAMKKLLVSGFEKIFQITRSYRNKETGGSLHNPEFTMIEWYRAYASYLEIMDDVEYLWSFLKGTKIEFERIKVKDAFKKFAGVAIEDFEDEKKFVEVASKKGYKLEKGHEFEDAFQLIFLNEIEPKLGFDKPVIMYEYPASMAALSKKCEADNRYAERFEVYINGIEIANAFTELNDPVEQKQRLESERIEREKMAKDKYPVDVSFIEALSLGMPPAGGIALGVDRLVMLLTESEDINEVLYFPYKDL